MFRKKEKEFQYPPVIVKIIEDVVGGGTIARAALKGVIDELPPGVVVGKDTNGLYHPVKTAKVVVVAAADATKYKVAKKTIFEVGEIVALGGSLEGAAVAITAIDRSDIDFDEITVGATLGAAAVDDVLVLAAEAADAGDAAFKYKPEAITMNKVDTTVANQQSGLLVRGTVNEAVMPYPVDDAIKVLLPLIRFV
ncbi:hypothetical protein SAMN05216357_11074 [Porphyromonadaceae bacterium KH3CP3RA]|nr:hypothetical protein SAMN05216357_11074 [Porphyromonadaceae bacterium KH3CP3RA]